MKLGNLFPLKLRVARKMKGLTQAQVATAVGITLTSYRRYENGACEPMMKNLTCLATVLGVTPNWLVGFDGTAENEIPLTQIIETAQEKQRADYLKAKAFVELYESGAQPQGQ